MYTKDQDLFEDVLDSLWAIYEVGLTKVMGGRGQLEQRLNRIFLKNLIPTINTWVDHGRQDLQRTEKALLRYTLGHLVADLEADEAPNYAEEVRLAPPLENSVQTGALVRRTTGRTCHVVVTGFVRCFDRAECWAGRPAATRTGPRCTPPSARSPG